MTLITHTHEEALREIERIKALIVETLCSQALADHLGDVRDAEVDLWKILGVDPKIEDDYYDSAWERTRYLLTSNNIPLPEHLRDDDDQ